LLDAGWFDWIVWFHHPSRHAAAWESFTAEAGFDRDDPTTRELLRSLPLVRLSEILAGLPRGAPARGHWLEHLRSSLARSGTWAPRRIEPSGRGCDSAGPAGSLNRRSPGRRARQGRSCARPAYRGRRR
jgi:hypothetical protein